MCWSIVIGHISVCPSSRRSRRCRLFAHNLKKNSYSFFVWGLSSLETQIWTDHLIRGPRFTNTEYHSAVTLFFFFMEVGWINNTRLPLVKTATMFPSQGQYRVNWSWASVGLNWNYVRDFACGEWVDVAIAGLFQISGVFDVMMTCRHVLYFFALASVLWLIKWCLCGEVKRYTW